MCCFDSLFRRLLNHALLVFLFSDIATMELTDMGTSFLGLCGNSINDARLRLCLQQGTRLEDSFMMCRLINLVGIV